MFQNLTKNPRAAFLTTAIAISSLLFATIVIVTVWLLPVKYASFARVKITPAQTINSPSGSDENIQTEFLIIKSAVTLNEVTKELALDVILAEQLNLNRHLTQDETYRLLVKGIKLQQTCKDLPLIEIWVYDENKFTAATIANMVATVYAKQAIERNRPVNIVDYAKPGLRPKSPNIGLNILVGFPASLLVGILLGAIAGTAVWLWPGIPTSPRNGNH
jgi:capsular polysaccharide biosynthesis protein